MQVICSHVRNIPSWRLLVVPLACLAAHADNQIRARHASASMKWRSQIMTARCGTARFVAFRSSVVAVQSVVRGRAARRPFLALRQATITAQKLWRGRCVRRMLCTQKAAATLIQVLHVCHGCQMSQDCCISCTPCIAVACLSSGPSAGLQT